MNAAIHFFFIKPVIPSFVYICINNLNIYYEKVFTNRNDYRRNRRLYCYHLLDRCFLLCAFARGKLPGQLRVLIPIAMILKIRKQGLT